MCVCFRLLVPTCVNLCLFYVCVCVCVCVCAHVRMRACVCDLSNQSNRETHVTCLKPSVNLTT